MNTEVMEKKLYDACLKGDVEMLEALMREDELILARISLSSCFNQMHLACMLGHFEFAKSLISYEPDFASRLDSQGRSPLHLASANGYADIVGLLLLHDQKMGQVRDEDGKTPLHLAVMNGQQESVRELIKVNPESCNHEIGTALHLCVMYNRLNVLILILESTDQELANFKDDKGNTILHSATTLKRMQIIKYLVVSRSEVLDVNAVNENGVTALDIVEQMPKDVKTMEIKELLVSAGTLRATDQKIQAGVTALDKVEQMSKDVKTMEINELLVSAGTLKATDQKIQSAGTLRATDQKIQAGITTLDKVEQMSKDVKTMEINELLVSAGTLRATDQKIQSTGTLRATDQKIQAGVTALDKVEQMSKDVKNMEINKLLASAGTLRATDQKIQSAGTLRATDQKIQVGVTALDKVEQMSKDVKTMEINEFLVSAAGETAAAETKNNSKWRKRWRKMWNMFTSFTIFQETGTESRIITGSSNFNCCHGLLGSY